MELVINGHRNVQGAVCRTVGNTVSEGWKLSDLSGIFMTIGFRRKNQHMNQGAKTIAPEPANVTVSCH